jgi:hypothetical protein
MNEDVDGVRKVKEDQATDDRVKGLSSWNVRTSASTNVTLLMPASRRCSAISNNRGLVDAHHGALLPHKLRHSNDVAETRAKIEYPHPREILRPPQQQARRRRRHARLGIQAGNLGFIVAEYIPRLLGRRPHFA